MWEIKISQNLMTNQEILCQLKYRDEKVEETEPHKMWDSVRVPGYVQWENKNIRQTEKREST